MKKVYQTISIILVAVGLFYEIYFGADFGYIAITAGSLFFGISTKINDRKKIDK